MVDSFVGQRTSIDAKQNTMGDFGGLWWTMVDYGGLWCTISVKTDSFFIRTAVSGSEITL
jgi:hypothetical protein